MPEDGLPLGRPVAGLRVIDVCDGLADAAAAFAIQTSDIEAIYGCPNMPPVGSEGGGPIMPSCIFPLFIVPADDALFVV